jgi:hypothetical protein
MLLYCREALPFVGITEVGLGVKAKTTYSIATAQWVLTVDVLRIGYLICSLHLQLQQFTVTYNKFH